MHTTPELPLQETADAPEVNSAPNTDGNDTALAARTKEWRAEIPSRDGEYNAHVPMDLIEPDPNNRDRIDPEKVTSLAKSIESDGLLQPIILRTSGDGRYRLIAGEHRWRAHLELRRPTIAARIYRDADDLSAARKKTIENFQRVALTPIEEAKKYRELSDLGMKQREIGELLGKSQPVVANSLRLLDLPETVQKYLAGGVLSSAHGVSLARFKDYPSICCAIAAEVIAHGDKSKDLDRQPLPHAWELTRKGLAISIRTGSQEGAYKIPASLASQKGFVRFSDWETVYLLPENGEPNLWAPEKAKQDAARKEKEERAARAAEKAKKSGKLTPEALERKKVIERNKETRAKNISLLADAFEKIKTAEAFARPFAAILASHAVRGAYGVKRIQQAAELLGIALPKGFLSETCYGLPDVPTLASKLSSMDITRLAVAVIISKEVEDANRNADKAPPSVGLINALPKRALCAGPVEEAKV